MARLTDKQKHENRILATMETLAKKDTVGKRIKVVAADFQELVRLRHADADGFCRCVSCKDSKFIKWNSAKCLGEIGLDAGHYHGRTNAATIFEPINCHPQCVACNRNDTDGKAARAYKKFMQHNYTDKQLEALEQKKNGVRQWTTRELAEKAVRYREEIRAEKARIERGEPSSLQFQYINGRG